MPITLAVAFDGVIYTPLPSETMQHPTSMNQDPIFAFQYSTLQKALESWKAEQIEAYPHQAERIETVVAAMRDFMTSEHVRAHKMIVGTPPEKSS